MVRPWAAIILVACCSIAVSQDTLVYSRPGRGLFLQHGDSEDRIAFNQGPHLAPRFSPDGTQVLFTSWEPSDIAAPGEEGEVKPSVQGLWTLDLNTRAKTRICDGSQADWAPDGQRIAFQRGGRIFERDLDTGAESAFSPDDVPPLAHPSYAGPDAIICLDQTGEHIYRIERGGEARILRKGEFNSPPRISPDGAALAFQDGAHIHLLDFETGRTRQLTTAGGIQAWPAWAADGQHLCYAQAPTPGAEIWAIHRVDLAKPDEAEALEQYVCPAFDWLSPAAASQEGAAVGAPALRAFAWADARPPTDALAAPLDEGWRTVSEPEPGQSLGQAARIDQAKARILIAHETIRLAMPNAEAPSRAVDFAVLGADSGAPFSVKEVRLVEVTPSACTLDISMTGPEGSEVTLTLTTNPARPAFDIRTDARDLRLLVKAGLAHAIVPDRLANDVIIGPGDPLAPNAALPVAPVTLGLLTEPQSMLLVGTPHAEQAVDLLTGEEGQLDGFRVDLAGNAVTCALLAGQGIWQASAIAGSAAEWECPFPAAWRLAAATPAPEGQPFPAAYSRVWTQDQLWELGGAGLPIPSQTGSAPAGAIVYAWARDARTPADVLTPLDVLLSAWGVRGCAKAIQTEAVCGYRSGVTQNSGPARPFLELTTRPLGWEPWDSFSEKEDLGILEVMAAVFPTDTPGVRSLITHLGEDAIGLLEGLNARIAEYEAFVPEVQALIAAPNAAAEDPFLAWARTACQHVPVQQASGAAELGPVRDAFGGLLAALGCQEGRNIEHVMALCRAFPGHPLVAKVEQFLNTPGAKEGRLWHNGIIRSEIVYEEEFATFSRTCRRALGQQQGALRAYRALAKSLRDAAGTWMMRCPESRAAAIQIRERCAAVLGHRPYLEGDWRGETPILAGPTP